MAQQTPGQLTDGNPNPAPIGPSPVEPPRPPAPSQSGGQSSGQSTDKPKEK